ncbi:MAG: fibronectin type III-like domain-contianing protein [Bacteroidetes bacterium]|nr:fibronectin type III-like domain-contianing protein [Bacteroidota bacterium]
MPEFLRRFQRIVLASGESKSLASKIPASQLSFYDIQTNDLKVETGKWKIQIGSSSKDIRLKRNIIIQ